MSDLLTSEQLQYFTSGFFFGCGMWLVRFIIRKVKAATSDVDFT